MPDLVPSGYRRLPRALCLVVPLLWVPQTVGGEVSKAAPLTAFTVSYGEAEDPSLAEMRQSLTDGKVLEQLAEVLNDELALPQSIDLAMGECGQANAFYQPVDYRITLCYELLVQVAADLARGGQTQEEQEQLIGGAVIFVFLHELGHALIHVLDLPITGREEDPADQLATVVLADGSEEGASAAAAAAVWFYQSSKGTRLNRLAFADEHSLGKQRFFNILCWIYGQDPDGHPDLIGPKVLPQNRAERCPGEYQRTASSWEKLLAPYTKTRGVKEGKIDEMARD